MSYHCADKHNSNGAGDHDCIGSQLGMPGHGELQIWMSIRFAEIVTPNETKFSLPTWL